MFSSRLGRALLPLVALTVLSTAGMAAEGPPSASWRTAVLDKLQESEYRFGEQPDGAWSAPNRAQSLRSFVTGEVGLRLVPRTAVSEPWELRLNLEGIGRGESLVPPGPVTLSSDGNRIERLSRGLVEWLVNEPKGIEHGFTIASPPAGLPRELPLVLDIAVWGDLAARVSSDRTGIQFTADSGQHVLSYEQLTVFDARGDRLDARFEYETNRLRIVVDDRGAAYPVVVDPLVTVPDWSVTSNQSGSDFGISVAGAGDLDADGFDDVIVGAARYDNGEADEGHVFVYLGSPGGPDTDPVWHAESNHAGARLGRSVAGNCNVNNDAYADAIFGAPYWDDGVDVDEGAVFVYHGSPNALDAELLRPVGLPGNADWTAEGDKPVSEFGRSVACAGDVNDDVDDVDDIIVGSRNYTNDQSIEGAAFVYHGSSFADGLGLNGARPVGNPGNSDWSGESNQVGAEYGHTVSPAGDINGDAVDDILVGAPSYQNNFFNEGRAYAYLGTPTGVMSIPIWVQDGGVDDGAFGSEVASAGDVNGDGLGDVLIGAEDWTNGQLFEGAAFLFLGKAGGLLGATPDWTLELNQTEAFVGSSVATAGDVNADGFDDVLVSAEGLDDGQLDEGAVFLFLGSPSGLPTTPASVFEVDQEAAEFGTSVASAGDVNGEGFDDILVGAAGYSLPEVQEGGAFIFYGCEDGDRDGVCQGVDNCPLLINPDQDDTDGDGIGDTCDACEDVDEDDVCDKPRVLVEWSGPGEQVIVEYGSSMRFIYNTIVDPNIGLQWIDPAYDDSSAPWQPGLYGVGYEEPPAGAPVGASDLLVTTNPPFPGTRSVYTRADFTIPAGARVDTLFLGVDYDDAYVAWLNGVEVFRSGEMPSGDPQWNTLPVRGHESSNGAVPVYDPLHDISFSGIPALNIGGSNTLAIGAWNAGAGSSDLVLVPRLSINRPVTNTMRYKANTLPPNLGLLWTALDFAEESTWTPGNYGVGYETGTGAEDLINTEVTSSASSVYSRAKFNVSSSAIDTVFLGADWDDGYVAWINGQEVYRTPGMPGTPGSLPAWNVSGVPEHESSNLPEPDYGTLHDITTSALPSIVDGENVLALSVWRNDAGGIDDLVLVPRLSINEDNVDNCIGVANPGQGDVDEDGLGDDCDPDIDGDTLPNGSDNCPYVDNFNQNSCDTDGTGDACDPCPCDANDDVDSDGYCDGVGFNAPKVGDQDNCPSTHNPDQKDENTDGEGDACDPDIDGDGHLNGDDNCPFIPNDQTDVDGDNHGFECDCNDGDINVWAKPAAIDSLRLVRDDVCVAFSCTESLTPCGTDADCLIDTCGAFACTESFSACTTNAECLKDECASFTCSVGLNGCGTDSDCIADFCSTKSCTVGLNGCATDGDCTADACANKTCTEGQNACTTNLECVISPTDICIGSCTLGGNACVTDAACSLDRCEGSCSVGGNTCTNDAVCTQDVCEGSCTVGGNSCTDDSVCTQPQTDICRGSCSLGSNPCFDDFVCTQAQTDVCEGSCSLSDTLCVADGQCVDPSADTLRWQVPQLLGANTVRYDTLRSLSDTDFTTATTCVETDGVDSETIDPTLPTTAGEVLVYLIRIENDCPVSGATLGRDSLGTERSGRTCP